MRQPVCQDDQTIEDGERLLRRVPASQIVRDDDTGKARISSGAFCDRELSVDIEAIFLKTGKRLDDYLLNFPGFRLVCVSAGCVRHHGQAVCRDPLPDNPAHALVCGSKNNKQVRNGLRDCADWVVPSEPPDYEVIERETLSNKSNL